MFVRLHSTGLASVNAVGEQARAEARDETQGVREIARRFTAWLPEAL